MMTVRCDRKGELHTKRRLWFRRGGPIIGGLLTLTLGLGAWAQQVPAPLAPEHGGHGTPEEWKFTWPAGDPARGREVFVKLECFSCHEVKGEQFPRPDAGLEPGKVGPELSFMAPLHPPEYFAEAIINPSAVIEEGKGYRAPDGKSKMPSYNDLVTVQEVIDLVAYLKGLKGTDTRRGQDSSGGHMMAPGHRMPGN